MPAIALVNGEPHQVKGIARTYVLVCDHAATTIVEEALTPHDCDTCRLLGNPAHFDGREAAFNLNGCCPAASLEEWNLPDWYAEVQRLAREHATSGCTGEDCQHTQAHRRFPG